MFNTMPAASRGVIGTSGFAAIMPLNAAGLPYAFCATASQRSPSVVMYWVTMFVVYSLWFVVTVACS